MPMTDIGRGNYFGLALSEDPALEMGDLQGSRVVLKGTNVLAADLMHAIRSGTVTEFRVANDLTSEQVSAAAEAIERILRA